MYIYELEVPRGVVKSTLKDKNKLCDNIKKHTVRVETKEDKTSIKKTKAFRKAKQFEPSQTVAVKKFPLCNTFEKENEDK
ncbi:jg2576, partial [Pararge aegeria aegeria]